MKKLFGFLAGICVSSSLSASLTLISSNAQRTASANGSSTKPSISADGMVIAFQSTARDLVLNDTNPFSDVFVFDVKTQTLQLVSVERTGTTSGDRDSSDPVVSADGRYVAFTSSSRNLVDTPVGGNGDVFIRDLTTSTTRLVSINRDGNHGGNRESDIVGLSADGSVVLFRSQATDLVAGIDNNDEEDIFVRDMRSSVTSLVSINRSGDGTASMMSFDATISADGHKVAFVSHSNNIIPFDGNDNSDVFVRDLARATTTLVSVSTNGKDGGNRGSFRPALSADGNIVAFHSFATDLVTNDTNGTDFDIYVRDLRTQKTTLVTVNAVGTGSGNADTIGSPQISADGRFVAYSSGASDLVSDDGNGSEDVFVRDLTAGRTIAVNATSAGRTGNGASFDFSLSSDGKHIAFLSGATDLGYNDTNATDDVFVRDLVTGALTLLSLNAAGTATSNGTPSHPKISSDGRVVVFESRASNLVANDNNSQTDIFASIPAPLPRHRAVRY
jgi:Tol biopolymer transport system component